MLFTLISLLVSAVSMAEWSKVGVGSKGFVTIYADLATIRKTNNGITMWSLFDYKDPQMLGDKIVYLSVKEKSEYDCEGENHRPLSFIVFSGNMEDKGQIVYSDHNGGTPWAPVSPQSLNEILWKTACNR